MFFFYFANCEKCSTFKWFNKLTHVFSMILFNNRIKKKKPNSGWDLDSKLSVKRQFFSVF